MIEHVREKCFQIVADHGTSHSAWTKAPADVATIAESVGFVRIVAGRFRLGGSSFFRRAFRKLRLESWVDRLCWRLEFVNIRRLFGKAGGELLLQHPLPGHWTASLQNIDEVKRLKDHHIKITVMVHDIGALRGSSKEVGGGGDHTAERLVFQIADKLIVHNDCMRDYVVKMGVKGEVVSLNVFDYLVAPDVGFVAQPDLCNRSVLLAGGFGPAFAKYVCDLKYITRVQWVLYGHLYDEVRMGADNVHYLGKFDASHPPVDCGCKFGLVWNGESIDTCSGDIGEYLRFCNNHKLSLFLAMGLPVIVWKEAAVSAFVEKNQVGVTVASLREIPDILEKMPSDDYALLMMNARRIAGELRAGKYTKVALLKK